MVAAAESARQGDSPWGGELSATGVSSVTASAPPRRASIDAFRGAAVALMLLVNNPGDWDHVYAPLRHSEWHGRTTADLVFPSFLWIVGLVLSLSFESRLAAGASRGALFRMAARRAAVLFAIGIFLCN